MKVYLHTIEHELEEKFLAASGPGGQNVNKVATAVQLRFNLEASHAFGEEQKARMRRVLKSRLTDSGDIVLFVQTHRSQQRNREEARQRLIDLLEKALVIPKRRVATKPTRASKERRLSGKTHRGQVKRARGQVDIE